MGSVETRRNSKLAAAVWLVSSLALFACGQAEQTTDVAARAPAAFDGTYRVSGQTVEPTTGNARDIEGVVILVQEGDAYTATFDLETLFPTADGPTAAEVVGKGAGSVSGNQLDGTTETQIILSQVPGVDANFLYMPRQFGPRLQSTSEATLNDDGSVTIKIASRAQSGEEYVDTTTTLRGTRVEADE